MNPLMRMSSPIGAEIVLDGRRVINFAGSSYLGLSGHRDILDAGRRALNQYGAGYQFARALGVATNAHLDVEEAASHFFGAERALYLSGGYQFGLAGVAGLNNHTQRIFLDEQAHYCLRDGAGASGLPYHVYAHLDVDHLHQLAARHLRKGEVPLIISDALYSVRGEPAPLQDLVQIAAMYQGALLIDESHSFGVLGEGGRGACQSLAHEGVTSIVFGGSLGKAFGAAGGLIVCSAADEAAFRAAPSTRGAMQGTGAAAAMAAASLNLVARDSTRIDRLRDNARYAKKALSALGLETEYDASIPIAAFRLGDEERHARLQHALLKKGFYVLHTHYIGAGAGGLIRCAFFADHTPAQIDAFVDALGSLL